MPTDENARADRPAAPRPGRLAVVTSSRADLGHLLWPLRDLLADGRLDVRLIATGAHLAPAWGRTEGTIEALGLPVAERVDCQLAADTRSAMVRTLGLATIEFAGVLERLEPDLVLVIADRLEMLAPAQAALALRVPIAHVEGGERSAGAIDDAIRNALTMLAQVHLVTTAGAARRVIAMGIEPWRVRRVGAGSLDHVRRTPDAGDDAVEAALGGPLDPPPIVVAHHAVTLDPDGTAEATAVLEACSAIAGRGEHRIVFCLPNADAGGQAIAARMRAFVERFPAARLLVNLEPALYWSLLRRAACMLGNSSSGVMESPSIPLPAIDVGRRQQGRERAANVLHAAPTPDAIAAALARALDPAFRAGLSELENPYGDGRCGPRMVRVLTGLPDRATLLARTDRLGDHPPLPPDAAGRDALVDPSVSGEGTGAEPPDRPIA